MSTAHPIARPAPARPATGIAPAPGTSIAAPLSFMATGIVALMVGAIWLVMRPETLTTYHYNQQIIALTHLFTLGWICSVVMGAMYQLVPVALETKLHSQRLAQTHFVLHLAGFVGMVAMFRIWNMQWLGLFACLVVLGVLVFIYNLARTLASIPRWNFIAAAITSALAWLLLTVLFGLFLAATKLWPISPFAPLRQMHAHAHLGGIGFFLMMIVGVSYKLVPMFSLGEVTSPSRARWSVGLLNAGLAGLFITILIGSPWKLAFAVVVMAALAIYGCELAAILRARKRRALDWGIKYFITAILLLLPLALLALPLSWAGLPLTPLTGQLESVYGLLALLGVVTLAILGMLYKIVPFLVWFAAYGKQIGRRKVPALASLYSARLQVAGYALFLPGLALTSIATAVGHVHCARLGTLLFASSVLVFVCNMTKCFSHLLPARTDSVVPAPAGAMKGAA